MMTKTIVLTCNSSFGLVNFRMALMRRLQSEGYRVVAVAPRDEYSAQLEAAGIEVHDWHLSARSTHLSSEVRALSQLIGIYKTLRPDLCFHYTVKAVLYGALAARWTGVRYVSVITGLGYVFLNESIVSRCARLLYRLLLNNSFRVWFLNHADLDEFVRLRLVKAEKAEIIPGEGVDTDHFQPIKRAEATEINFLVVARLLRDKGIFEFVDAVGLLRERGHRFKANILGERGNNNPAGIPDYVVDNWVECGIVNYLGTTRDVRPHLQAASCVVLPSYREGIPLALLEASAMATPVIATNVPGCQDVVAHGVNGYLCEARDSIALANCMEEFLKLRNEERTAMGDRGRDLVKRRFAQNIVIKRYIEILGRLNRSI